MAKRGLLWPLEIRHFALGFALSPHDRQSLAFQKPQTMRDFFSTFGSILGDFAIGIAFGSVFFRVGVLL